VDAGEGGPRSHQSLKTHADLSAPFGAPDLPVVALSASISTPTTRSFELCRVAAAIGPRMPDRDYYLRDDKEIRPRAKLIRILVTMLPSPATRCGRARARSNTLDRRIAEAHGQTRIAAIRTSLQPHDRERVESLSPISVEAYLARRISAETRRRRAAIGGAESRLPRMAKSSRRPPEVWQTI